MKRAYRGRILTPREGGRLLLRVDPRGFFTNVDFAALTRRKTRLFFIALRTRWSGSRA